MVGGQAERQGAHDPAPFAHSLLQLLLLLPSDSKQQHQGRGGQASAGCCLLPRCPTTATRPLAWHACMNSPPCSLTQLAVCVSIDLGNQHAVLELGVGGNLHAQLSEGRDQALAVAAP